MNILRAGRPSVSNKQKAIQDVQEQKDETIKMVINMSRSFHKQIKQRALDEDITITELVHRAIKEYMNKDV